MRLDLVQPGMITAPISSIQNESTEVPRYIPPIGVANGISSDDDEGNNNVDERSDDGVVNGNYSNNNRSSTQVYQGYVAALKESFGFIETCSHDKEIFFHFRLVFLSTFVLGSYYGCNSTVCCLFVQC